ncbi:MAG: aromatic ring-opening dioxygenase LigA [Actinomycetota bacterium]
MSRTTTTVTTTTRSVKLIGIITIFAGLLMIVAGAATWTLVTIQLKAEHITVSAVSDKAPGPLAGKPVAGPFTAYAQANAINHHALLEANNRTYAELGADTKALKAKLTALGANKEDIAKDPGIIALADSRANTMTGSFLRASLFTSVISFGVAALAMGLGVLFALLGFALTRVSRSEVVTSALPVAGEAAAEPVPAKA